MNALTLPTCDAGAREAASIKHWCMHREKLLFAKLLSAKLLLTTLLLVQPKMEGAARTTRTRAMSLPQEREKVTGQEKLSQPTKQRRSSRGKRKMMKGL